MPELTEKLDTAARVAEELRAAETTVDEVRARFRVALREAHEAGASYGLLGRVVGLSRQRVARIIAGS
jgi:hypothetical protein